MTTRPRAATRAQSDRGREYGVMITSTDIERLALLARWYCLTPAQLAHAEMPITDWHPDYRPDGHPSDDYTRRLVGIKARLAKLARIIEHAPAHVGPLARSVLVDPALAKQPTTRYETAWHATRYGATAAGVPWEIRPTISPHNAAHAILAADIGLQLEATGVRVLSEREIVTGLDRHGDQITAPLTSSHTSPGGRVTDKRPDLAVLHADNTGYIAIEIERQTSRSIRLYIDKITAYIANPHIHAIWYLCASDTTARRVSAAAIEVLGEHSTYPLRIRTVTAYRDHHEIPNLLDETGPGRYGTPIANPLRSDLEATLTEPTSRGTHR